MSSVRLTAKGERWMRNAYVVFYGARAVAVVLLLVGLIGVAGWIETGGN